MFGLVHDTASELLSLGSFRDLCMSVLDRCLLDDGRFEAGRFGHEQHSSASAGAVLNGVCSIPFIPGEIRRRTRESGYRLISADGYLRGHDEHPHDGTTSWSLAQVLLGIAKEGDRFVESVHYTKALSRLLSLQNRDSGSWPLRVGDFDDTSFAFYPTLLFERLIRSRASHAGMLLQPLRLTASYLLNVASSAAMNTDMVLAVSALDRISALGELTEQQLHRYLDCKAKLLTNLVDEAGQIQLEDKYIQNELQPRWHSITWSPLLYACTRSWGGERSDHNLQVANRLIDSFDPGEKGWRGPSHPAGKVSSWSSSLALFNVYLLARDVSAAGLGAQEYLELMRSSRTQRRFNIVISFGGPDRAVAQEIRDYLVGAGLRVFFDADFRPHLLGEDLTIVLQDIYFRRSLFAVAVLSRSFLESEWASNWEWKAVLARMNKQREGYLLPYFLERVEVPGLNPTIGYMSADEVTPREFAEVVRRKIMGGRR